MTYAYYFVETTVGDLSFQVAAYTELQEGLVRLREELSAWNAKARAAGADQPPYQREVEDLGRMIRFGERELERAVVDVSIDGISGGSLAYLRAGIEYRIRLLAQDAETKRREGWPSGALSALRQKIDLLGGIASRLDEEFGISPSPVLWEVLRPAEAEEVVSRLRHDPESERWDVFICHASEDKESFVRSLATALADRGLRVWFDEFELHVGNSLSRAISRGLSASRFGVVVLSPSFIAKEWPQWELEGLVARQVGENPVILPIWHQIDVEGVRRFSPPLADLFALQTENGLESVVEGILHAVKSG